MSQCHLMQLLYQQEEFMSGLLLPFKHSKWLSKPWFALCSLLLPKHHWDKTLINNQYSSSQGKCHSYSPWKINIAVAFESSHLSKRSIKSIWGIFRVRKRMPTRDFGRLTDQSRNVVKQHAHNPTGSQGISICNAIGIQPCDVLIWFPQYCF